LELRVESCWPQRIILPNLIFALFLSLQKVRALNRLQLYR